MIAQDAAIEEITRRLVDFYHPVRIYLFGSAARGDGGPDSDLDFCVVVPDATPDQLLRPGANRQAPETFHGAVAAGSVTPHFGSEHRGIPNALRRSTCPEVLQSERCLLPASHPTPL